MADKNQDQWYITLDELLKHSPDEVLELYAHDFRNVLAAIQSSLDLLTDPEFEPEEPERIMEMLKASTRKGYNGLDILRAYIDTRSGKITADHKPS